jgi:N-acetylmuramoyl-L-alanine amidase
MTRCAMRADVTARRFLWRSVPLAFGLALAAALLLGGQALAAPSTQSTTVTQQSAAVTPAPGTYDHAVQALAGQGIVNVAGDPTFAPSALVTRAEMAVYLARALKLAQPQYGDFLDLDLRDWGYGSMTAVHRAGVMDGTSLLVFTPDRAVTRQEAMALVVAALRRVVDKQGAEDGASLAPDAVADWLVGFRDRKLISPQYAAGVAAAYRAGLFDMPADGWLLPAMVLTQQELALMLERAFVEKVLPKPVAPPAIAAVTAYPKLSRGSSGGLVKALESRLAALGYPCGSVDGKYDSRTKDAVMAFEKYYRLKRNGVVTDPVWQHFFTASAPTPVLNKSGRRVEVDLSRQILMMIVDNKVVMTIHVSTGKHGTPTGTWHIRTLSKGWRMCSLGPIFSPCYFMARNAIHGYPSVPTYPASHGCVRTPIWVQNSLVSQLRMGIPVDVFYNRAK